MNRNNKKDWLAQAKLPRQTYPLSLAQHIKHILISSWLYYRYYKHFFCNHPVSVQLNKVFTDALPSPHSFTLPTLQLQKQFKWQISSISLNPPFVFHWPGLCSKTSMWPLIQVIRWPESNLSPCQHPCILKPLQAPWPSQGLCTADPSNASAPSLESICFRFSWQCRAWIQRGAHAGQVSTEYLKPAQNFLPRPPQCWHYRTLCHSWLSGALKYAFSKTEFPWVY